MTLKEAAIQYAGRRWPVFPCQGKKPLTDHGFKDASTDVVQVAKWWDRWPDASIGFAVPDYILVVDVDAHGVDGSETMKGLELLYGPLPPTPTARTGGGGRHYFFKVDTPLKCSVNVLPGIDTRTAGGYVILPPSKHASGNKYQWEAEPWSTPFATLPEWWSNALFAKPQPPRQKVQNIQNPVYEGQRNAVLFKLASSLRAKGLSESAILAALREENEQRCNPPLDDSEVQKLVHSAGKYEQGQVHTAYTDFTVITTTPPNWEAGQGPAPLQVISARDLMATTLKPLIQAVDRLICEGLTFLVAASKVGKSWMVLLMALCVANGEPFWGRKTTKCRVIYFALEDSQRRLQQRLQTMSVAGVPDNLSFVTQAQMLDTGFDTQLEQWLLEDTSLPALVIVDTFQKVRGVSKGGTNAYQQDYEVVGALKALADKYHAMIVCVHHTNKNRFATDPYDKISGSTGIMGAADTTILIDRERGTDTATVKYEGRDAWGKDFIIRFNNGVWMLENEDAEAYTTGQRYDAEPLVQLFRLLMAESPGGGRWTYSNLQAKGLELFGYQPFSDGRDCALKLSDGLADEIRKRDNILVECGVQTTGGKGIRLQEVRPVTAFQTRIATQPSQTTLPTESQPAHTGVFHEKVRQEIGKPGVSVGQLSVA